MINIKTLVNINCIIHNLYWLKLKSRPDSY